MKKTLLMAMAACGAAACFADGGAMGALVSMPTNAAAKVFTALPRCRHVEGAVLVRKPGGTWVPAEEGVYYPFGTFYRAEKGAKLVVAFGATSSVTASDGSGFGTRSQKVGEKSRTVVLSHGTIEVKLPSNLPEGHFMVAAPGFLVKNPAGEARITYADKGDGDEASIRCVTGTLGVEGRHFDIAAMHSANEVRIRTSRDQLATVLTGVSGDYVVKVDQGFRNKEEFGDDGVLRVVPEKADLLWHLTPFTKVLVNRSVPAIGSRMSVHTMVFDPTGVRKSECAFCEGRAEINTGEMVPKEEVSGEELAKRAAAMTEETDAAQEGGDASGGEASSDDSSSDDSSSGTSEESEN